MEVKTISEKPFGSLYNNLHFADKGAHLCFAKNSIAVFGKVLDYEDITQENLLKFMAYMHRNFSSGYTSYLAANLAAALNRASEKIQYDFDYKPILKHKASKPVKTFLNTDELKRLEKVKCWNDSEEKVRMQFLIGAYTGARFSDIENLSTQNIIEKKLCYVSQKTRIYAEVPLKPIVSKYLQMLEKEEYKTINMQRSCFDNKIKAICLRAKINEKTMIVRGDKTKIGEKWQFISSHTARVSFITNLSDCNVSPLILMKMAGHTSIDTTLNYIAKTTFEMNDQTKAYFR